jgi:hypothetical protein
MAAASIVTSRNNVYRQIMSVRGHDPSTAMCLIQTYPSNYPMLQGRRHRRQHSYSNHHSHHYRSSLHHRRIRIYPAPPTLQAYRPTSRHVSEFPSPTVPASSWPWAPEARTLENRPRLRYSHNNPTPTISLPPQRPYSHNVPTPTMSLLPQCPYSHNVPTPTMSLLLRPKEGPSVLYFWARDYACPPVSNLSGARCSSSSAPKLRCGEKGTHGHYPCRDRITPFYSYLHTRLHACCKRRHQRTPSGMRRGGLQTRGHVPCPYAISVRRRRAKPGRRFNDTDGQWSARAKPKRDGRLDEHLRN